jgi:hypothetical protein
MNNEHYSDERLRGILNQKVTSKVSSIGKDLMEFRSSFQQSAQGIIDNVGMLLNTLEDELLEQFRAEVSTVEQGVRSKLEPEVRLRVESEARQRYDQELQEQLSAARKATAEGEHQKFQSKLDVLSGALREICQQQAQVEILTCFLDKAAIFAERVAFFVVKSGSIVGWQARGFEGEFKNESVRSLVFPPNVSSVFKQVAESKGAFRGSPALHPDLSEVVLKFGRVLPEMVYVIPLVVRGKTVALLYADYGSASGASVDMNSLDILMTGVSQTVELSSARAKLGIKPAEGQIEVQPQASSPTGTVAAAGPAAPTPPTVVPKPPSTQEESGVTGPSISVEAATLPPVFHEPAVSPEPASSVTPEAARPAGPSLSIPPISPRTVYESVTPMVAAPLPLETLSEAEQKLHNDARRFARLLVSEIKLYNEQKVLEGRQEKNLYDLLRDDIDKSREMYDKRVAPEVAARVDYFYEELVRILADSQVHALGRNCPGPVTIR